MLVHMKPNPTMDPLPIYIYKEPRSITSKTTEWMIEHKEVHGASLGPSSPPGPQAPIAGWPTGNHEELGRVAVEQNWGLGSGHKADLLVPVSSWLQSILIFF